MYIILSINQRSARYHKVTSTHVPSTSKEALTSTFHPQPTRKFDNASVLSELLGRYTDSNDTYLCFIEWIVESGQVVLHQFEEPHQEEHVHHLTATELLQRVVPQDRKHLEQLVTYLINGELERCETEFRIFDSAEKPRWVYGKGMVQYHSPQSVAKIVGLVIDIHAKERISDAPDVTYPFFGEIETLPIGIAQLDLPAGTITTANEVASQILRLPANTAIHSFPDTDTAEWVSVSEALYRQKQVFNQLLKLPSIDRWVLFSGRRTGDKVTAVFQDITSLKEESVSLQKVNAELDNFVYHASHDLRAPLRSILGSLNLLKKEDNPAEREKCVELIEGSINRLDTFITDLLSVSRNRRKENPLVHINFMVEVETAVASSYHVGSTQNLEVVTKISQPCSFMADLTRVRVILNNLISNAIKYRRYDTTRSHITIEVWVDAKKAHLKISDNGEGIAESKIDHIFDMFYRASDRSEGSGLGLYIVKDVVQKLGGSIAVRSTIGKGTTFSLSFPNHYTGES